MTYFLYIIGLSRGRSKGKGPYPQSEVWPPLTPQMKFLVSATGHLGLKLTDYMLVFCPKLHVLLYDRQNFPSDCLPFGDTWPTLAHPKWRFMELRLPLSDERIA